MRLPRHALRIAASLAFALVAGVASPSRASQYRWHDAFTEAAEARLREEPAERDGYVTAFVAAPAASLVEELASPAWTRRSAASITLARRGAEVVPELAAALRSPRPWLRAGAAATVARIGQGAAGASGALVPLVADEAPFVRYHAVRAIAAADPARAVAALLRDDGMGLSDPDPVVRRAATEAAGLLGAVAVPRLRDLLRTGGAGAEPAAKALGTIGPAAADAVPDLRAVFVGGGPSAARAAAARALGAVHAVAALPDLVRALHDRRDGRVATAAAEALAALGPDAAPAAADVVAEWFRLASDQRASGENFRELRPQVRVAVRALGPAAAPVLGDALAARDPYLLREGTDLLGEIGDAGVAQLVRALGSADARVRTAAVRTLEELGPAAAGAVPGLVAALREESAEVRLYAASALSAIDPERGEVLPVLAAALDDVGPEGLWRYEAARAAGRLGPRAASLAPRIRTLCMDRATCSCDLPVLFSALVRIDPGGWAALDAVLAEPTDLRRGEALLALCDLAQVGDAGLGYWLSAPAGPDYRAAARSAGVGPRQGVAAEAVARFVTVLGDPTLCDAAARALEAGGAASVAVLRAALRAPSASARRIAAATLVRLGPAARDAIREAAGSTDPEVRAVAAASFEDSGADAIDLWLIRFPTREAQAADAAWAAYHKASDALESAFRHGELPSARQAIDAAAVEWPEEWVRPDLVRSWRSGGPWKDHGTMNSGLVVAIVRASGAAAVPGLVSALDAPDARHRLIAATLLDSVVDPSPAPLPSASAWRSVDSRYRPPRTADPAVVDAVRSAATPALRRLARGPDAEVACAAAATLAALGPLAPEEAAPLVRVVRTAFDDVEGARGTESPSPAERALRLEAAVASLTAAPAELLAPLGDALRGPAGPERLAAARALADLDATPAGAVEALRALVVDGSDAEKVYAAAALSRRGDDPAPLAPVLAAGLSSESPSVIRAALRGLGRCGAAAAPYAGDVVGALEWNGGRVVRRAGLADAVGALVAAGPAVEPFAIRIAAVVQDRRHDGVDAPGLPRLLRSAAREPTLRVPLLLSLVPTDPACADEVADALAAEGPEALVAYSVALDQSAPPFGVSAVLACARMGPAAAPLLDRIEAWTQSDVLRLYALGRLGPAAWRTLPALEERACATCVTWSGRVAEPAVYRAAVERVLGW